MVGQNGRMSTPEFSPRPAVAGMVVTWAFGALSAVAVGLIAPVDHRFVWFAVCAGACVFVAFAVNLASGRAEGFLVHTAAAALGAFAMMGVIALIVFLVTALSQIDA